MTKKTGNPKGRPKGSKQGRWSLGHLRDAARKAHTEAEWIEILRRLPEMEQWRILVSLEPKNVSIDSAPAITLLINGIRQEERIDLPRQGVIELQEAEPPRALPPSAGWSKRLPPGKAEKSESLRSLKEPQPPVPPPEPEPVRGPVFRVPSIDDDGPVLWRDPLIREPEEL